MNNLRQLTRSFWKENSGNMAMTFAISSIVLLTAGGMAVDYSRTMTVQNKLQVAADATALAAAHHPEFDDSELQNYGQNWFKSNGGNTVDAKNIQFTIVREGNGIIVDVTSQVPTSITGIIGIESLPGRAHSEVMVGGSSKPTELVIAVDTTGSMNFGGNWDKAKLALADMANTLKDASGKKDFSITLLPFNDRVKLGKTRGKAWAHINKELKRYKGCLEPRHENKGSNKYALTDKAPNEKSFDPSALGYFGPIYFGNSDPVCPKEIVGPTNNIKKITKGLDDIVPGGTGRFDIGMAWAWRLLSPNWQGLWGDKDYPSKDKSINKVVVFLTDGHTIAYENEVFEGGSRQPWGYNNGTPRGFENFAAVCKAMKDDGIEIHALFLRGNNHFVPYMKSCASTEEHFHDISSINDFKLALGKIGEVSGNTIRLTK